VANDPENAPIGPTIEGDPALDSLEDRIAAARAAEDARLAKDNPPANPATTGALTVMSTMVGYPLGGIIVGFCLDNIFGTLPWITILLMFLAFAGGCLHAMRLVKDRTN
jgi:ATP synthase protein I